jgi:hypothetical protein
MIDGLIALTVKLAGELVTEPAGPDTTTVKTEPVSPIEVGGVV